MTTYKRRTTLDYSFLFRVSTSQHDKAVSRVWSANKGNFSRHVKRCGPSEHRVTCPFCPKTFSRNDLCKQHIKNKHPTVLNRMVFTAENVEKPSITKKLYLSMRKSVEKLKLRNSSVPILIAGYCL